MKAIIAVASDQATQSIACIIQAPSLLVLVRMYRGCTALMDRNRYDRVGINALANHPDIPGIGVASVIFDLDGKSRPRTDESLAERSQYLRDWLMNECGVTEVSYKSYKTRGDLCIDLGQTFRLN
jgi:hypothetical protein